MTVLCELKLGCHSALFIRTLEIKYKQKIIKNRLRRLKCVTKNQDGLLEEQRCLKKC